MSRKHWAGQTVGPLGTVSQDNLDHEPTVGLTRPYTTSLYTVIQGRIVNSQVRQGRIVRLERVG